MPLLSIKNEIEKDEYLKLKDLSQTTASFEWAKNHNATDVFYGRGIYNFYLSEENDKYYAKMKIGNSCD